LKDGIKTPPLGAGGLYIHIPFCKQACHYCDFHFSTTMGKKDAMVAALQKELVLRKDEFKEVTVETIYFGGGTPSVLTIGELQLLIDTVFENYTVSKDPEITIEVNPDDLIGNKMSLRAKSRSIFEEYLEVGINRLSIGIQSFFDEDLKLMNRAHSAIEAEKSLSEAVRHFDNISIDLIYGMPNMSNDRWKENLQRALSFNVPHISSYALTVEPKTALAAFIKKGSIKLLDDGAAQEHFNILLKVLEGEGYVNYEISNFGKPGYFSKNNTFYWLGKKYIGIGPSAHSYDGECRGWNINNNPKYIKSIEKNELPRTVEVLSKTDKYNEYVMTGLRTIWGVSFSRIKEEYGDTYFVYLQDRAKRYLEQQLLVVDEGNLMATKKGKFLIDGIASDLFMLNLNQP
jgi:oxygen-independent coproporphyrinogen-3 oxidase